MSESGRIVGVIFVDRRILVQVEDLLNRGCDRLSVIILQTESVRQETYRPGGPGETLIAMPWYSTFTARN